MRCKSFTATCASGWLANYNTQPKAKSRNAKKDKEPAEPSELQEGFDFIREEGPRCSIGTRQLEWAEIEIRRQGSPVFGWFSGLVKECLKGTLFSTGVCHPGHQLLPDSSRCCWVVP